MTLVDAIGLRAEAFGPAMEDDDPCPIGAACEIWLQVGGAVIGSGEADFLYGSLACGIPMRSLLLRRERPGDAWVETLESFSGSEVIGMWRAGTGEVWAVLGWVVEGPGDLFVARSDDERPDHQLSSSDGGLTWRRVISPEAVELGEELGELLFCDGEARGMEVDTFSSAGNDDPGHGNTWAPLRSASLCSKEAGLSPVSRARSEVGDG